VDFLINDKTIFEVYGHQHFKAKNNLKLHNFEKSRITYLRNKGYNVIFISTHKIN
jgi:very-short-patch-repair endonuclease